MNTTNHRREAHNGFETQSLTSSNPGDPGGTDKPLLDDYTREQVRIRSKILVDQFELPLDQQDDLQQDMLLELHKAAKRFKPAKASWHTFVSRVLDCFCKYYTRRESCRNRRSPRETPCSDIAEDFSLDRRPVGPGVLAGLVSDEDRRRLRQVIAELPDNLRRLWEALMDDTSKRAAARKVGISKSTLYRRLATIREHFEEAGIEFFRPTSGTHFGQPQK